MSHEHRGHGPHKVGHVKEVTSLANPIIKDIKALSDKKTREQSGTFMAEGLKLVIDAIELGWTIRTLVYAKAAKGKALVEQMAAKTVAMSAGGSSLARLAELLFEFVGGHDLDAVGRDDAAGVRVGVQHHPQRALCR